MNNSALGKHLIIDFFDCNLISICIEKADLESITEIILKELNLKNITVLSTSNHFFSENAISISFHLAESHLNIHTWPENNYVSFDFFCCSLMPDLEYIMDEISNFCDISFFKSKHKNRKFLERGIA